MGGQTFTKDGLVLDMRQFNKIELNKEQKTVHVQSGANWEQIQRLLDKEGLAVKAMQSINIFSVGGTLSVNAHGIAHDPGPVAPTVKSMRVMLSSGEIKTASRTQNQELFRHVLGGYGLFGIILDVELEVVDNEMYAWKTDYTTYKNFPEFYKQNVEGNQNIGLMYGRLSMSPFSYLEEAAVHTYVKLPEQETIPALKLPTQTWINRLVINFSKTGAVGRWLRWTLEKYIEPKIHTCLSRNEALNQKEACIVSRNQEMYDSMGYLKNNLKDTDILQEYFIPHSRMPEFIDGLRETVKKNDANLLNVTIRIVEKDTDTALPYAKENMFAFVLYFNQKFNEKDSEKLRKTTVDLIDVATSAGGTYYLPYQLYYTPEQMRKAYPEADSFFATKKKYDPQGLFSNKWYEKYGKVN
jgi:FAD/FMN-containing dehydrogenase